MGVGLEGAEKKFNALGQRSRLAIYLTIRRAGTTGLTPAQIAETSGIRPNVIWLPLRVLVNAGLIVESNGAAGAIYAATSGAIEELLALFDDR